MPDAKPLTTIDVTEKISTLLFESQTVTCTYQIGGLWPALPGVYETENGEVVRDDKGNPRLRQEPFTVSKITPFYGDDDGRLLYYECVGHPLPNTKAAEMHAIIKSELACYPTPCPRVDKVLSSREWDDQCLERWRDALKIGHRVEYQGEVWTVSDVTDLDPDAEDYDPDKDDQLILAREGVEQKPHVDRWEVVQPPKESR